VKGKGGRKGTDSGDGGKAREGGGGRRKRRTTAESPAGSGEEGEGDPLLAPPSGYCVEGDAIKRTRGEEKGLNTRRFLHIIWGTVVLYYIFPPVVLNTPTWIVVFVSMILWPLEVEFIRLRHGILLFGMREHERHHVASYAWFMWGAALLLLLTPQQIAVPCIITTALVDPMISATRGWRRRYSLGLCLAVASTIFLFFGYHILFAVPIAAVAVIAESVDIRLRLSLRPNLLYSRSRKKMSQLNEKFDTLTRFDDDFTMQMIPAVILLVIYLNMPGVFPEPPIEPFVHVPAAW
jgi:dolichol kinase